MTAGHTLLIPKAHVVDLFSLDHSEHPTPGELQAQLLLAASSLSRRIIGALGAKGLNLLNNNGRMADQSQFHLHFHLIPRYGGDRLLHPYERTFGDWTEIRRHADEIRGFADPQPSVRL
jgi:histidine triad (HIT) family protein